MNAAETEFETLYASPSRNGIYKQKQFHGSGCRIVNMGELFGFDFISNQEMNRVQLTDSEMLSSTLEDGDLLFGRRSLVEAGAGKCSLVVRPSEPLTFESSIIRIRLNKKLANPKFYFYYFLSPAGRGRVRSIVSGTNVKGIRGSDLKKLRVQLPKKTAQDRIAEVLTTYDDLIENNRRRMALLEKSARLLYQEWFVRLRFPGHERTPIVDGLPKGWRSTPLGRITTKIGSGATPRGGEASYLEEGIPLIRSLNVYDDRFNDAGLAYINEDQADALDNVTVESHDILLNITGASVARCCMAPERYLPARVNQHVMIVRVDSSRANPFLVHAAINSDERKRQLLSYAQKGSTREALTKEMVSEFEITLPAEGVMKKFGEFAEAAFHQRETLAAQNQKLREACDLLLPRLMSGEIEV